MSMFTLKFTWTKDEQSITIGYGWVIAAIIFLF